MTTPKVDMRDTHASRLAELERQIAALKDPAAVHVNMLRGGIAKPTWEQIKHIYPAEVAELEKREADLAEKLRHRDNMLAEAEVFIRDISSPARKYVLWLAAYGRMER